MTLTPAFPLGTAYLPGDAVVLRVFETRYLEMLGDVMSGNQQFVSALISAGSEVGGGDHRFNVGVLVEIDHIEEADVGLMLYGHATQVVNILQWNDDAAYPQAQCETQGTVVSDIHAPQEIQTQMVQLAHAIQDFFNLLTSFNIPSPVPNNVITSLLPRDGHQATTSELWTLFWTLSRLLPSTPMSRCELLADQPLEVRITKAHSELEHLSEIVRFRYGP